MFTQEQLVAWHALQPGQDILHSGELALSLCASPVPYIRVRMWEQPLPIPVNLWPGVNHPVHALEARGITQQWFVRGFHHGHMLWWGECFTPCTHTFTQRPGLFAHTGQGICASLTHADRILWCGCKFPLILGICLQQNLLAAWALKTVGGRQQEGFYIPLPPSLPFPWEARTGKRGDKPPPISLSHLPWSSPFDAIRRDFAPYGGSKITLTLCH